MYIKEGMDTAEAARIAREDFKRFEEMAIEGEPLKRAEIDDLAKAASAGRGNRKQRRAHAANLKRRMKKELK